MASCFVIRSAGNLLAKAADSRSENGKLQCHRWPHNNKKDKIDSIVLRATKKKDMSR